MVKVVGISGGNVNAENTIFYKLGALMCNLLSITVRAQKLRDAEIQLWLRKV